MKAIKSNINQNGFFGRKRNGNSEIITIEDHNMDASAYNDNVMLFENESEAEAFIEENEMWACYVVEFIPEKEEDYFDKDGFPKF